MADIVVSQTGLNPDHGQRQIESEPRDAGATGNDVFATQCQPMAARCTNDRSGRFACDQSRDSEGFEACETDFLCIAGTCQEQLCVPNQLTCVDNVVGRCDDQGLGFLQDTLEDCAMRSFECNDDRCLNDIKSSRGPICETIECLEDRTADLICQRFRRDLPTVSNDSFEGGNN